MRRVHNPGRTIVADTLCLAAIVALSAVPYIGGLGFYGDDWSLLMGFQTATAEGRSFSDYALTGFEARPVQGVYLALLFNLFGWHPPGHHLVNTAVIASAVAMLYLLLLRLGVGRLEAFAAALIFSLLPQLSTVRVWYAGFQIPLSMTLALLSMHAQFSFARSGKISWLVSAFVAALLSIAAYEIFAPLLAAFAAWLAFLHHRDRRARTEDGFRRRAIALVAVVAAVAIAALVKGLLSSRTGPLDDVSRYLLGAWQLVRPDYDWRVHSSLNVFAAPSIHFWHPIRGWGLAAWELFTGQSTRGIVAVVAAAIAALAYWRLQVPDADEKPGMQPQRLLLLGLIVFVLGHATFLIVPSITFSPSGVGNRVLVAAAIGVAIILVALAALASRKAAGRHRRAAFSFAIALLAVGAVARIEQITRYWAEAPDIQRQVLGLASQDLQSVPAGSTVILDGVCPYHGPALVFESHWEIGSVLSYALGKQVSGDTLSSRARASSAGIETSIYKVPTFYAYGPDLYVYDPRLREVVRLAEAAAARRYFSERDGLKHCPPSYLGHGVLI